MRCGGFSSSDKISQTWRWGAVVNSKRGPCLILCFPFAFADSRVSIEAFLIGTPSSSDDSSMTSTCL